MKKIMLIALSLIMFVASCNIKPEMLEYTKNCYTDSTVTRVKWLDTGMVSDTTITVYPNGNKKIKIRQYNY